MDAVTATHAGAALAALALGAGQFALARRGSRHRVLGYLWVAAMAVTILSSFGLRGGSGFAWLGGFGPIHGLSLFSALAVGLAVRHAIRRDFRNHRRWVVGAYSGLVGAGLFAAAIPGRAMHALLFVDLPGVLAAWLSGILPA